MNFKWTLSLLTLVAGLTLLLGTPRSEAAPVQDDTPPVQDDKLSECLQACFEQYTENLEDCQDSCWVCDVWILFCVAGHTDEDCFETCSEAAKEIHQACKAECIQP